MALVSMLSDTVHVTMYCRIECHQFNAPSGWIAGLCMGQKFAAFKTLPYFLVFPFIIPDFTISDHLRILNAGKWTRAVSLAPLPRFDVILTERGPIARDVCKKAARVSGQAGRSGHEHPGRATPCNCQIRHEQAVKIYRIRVPTQGRWTSNLLRSHSGAHHYSMNPTF